MNREKQLKKNPKEKMKTKIKKSKRNLALLYFRIEKPKYK